MKIGILTFHCAHNYGAMLQAYATLNFLRGKGFEAEIVNYQPDFLKEPYRAFSFKRLFRSKRPKLLLSAIFHEIVLFYHRKKRKKVFDTFLYQYLVDRNEEEVVEIPEAYDVYIVGSDQVWNLDITINFIDAYFCKFKFSHLGKRYISYAASIGKTNLTMQEINHFKDTLKTFDALSVRESTAKKILQPYVDKDIQVVLDPTLILERKEWEKLVVSNTPTEKYIIVYQVREHPAVIKKAQDIARSLNAKVIQLVAWPSLAIPEEFQFKNPQDFISLIRNAACVVTTSFHATAFSIIFEIPFYVVSLGDGKDGRSESLLDICGLKSRMISIPEPVVFNTIDYSGVTPKLDRARAQSCEFLLKAITCG